MTNSCCERGNVLLFAALLAGAGLQLVLPMELSAQGSIGGQPMVGVYAEGIRGTAMLGERVNVRSLLLDLLQVEMARLRGFEFRGGQMPPPCGQPKTSLAAKRAPTAAAPGDSTFLNISGMIDGVASINIAYAISMCDRGTPKEVARGTQAVTPRDALQDILSAVRSISDAVEKSRPRVGVMIAFLENAKPQEQYGLVARAIEHGIADALWATDDLEPVEAAGAYLVEGRIHEVDRGVGVTINLRRFGDTLTLATLRAQAEPQSITAFAESIAHQVIEKLNQVRFTGAQATDPDGSAFDRARTLLCDGLPTDCKVSADAALANARLASTRDSSDARALVLVGEAELLKGRAPNAIQAFEQAIALIRRQPGRFADGAWLKRAHTGTGQAYSAAGNHAAAADAYARGAAIAGTSVDYYRLSRALRSAQKNLEALEAAVAGTALGDDTTGLAEARRAVNALHTGEVVGKTDRLAAACSIESVVAAQCADMLLRMGASLSEPADSAMKRTAEELFHAILELRGAPADYQARASLHLASLSLGTIRIAVTDGRLGTSSPGFDPPTADAHLQRAESLPEQQLSAPTREWLQSLRATYWAKSGRFKEARAAAERAQRTATPDDDANFLRGEIDLLEALAMEGSSALVSPDSAQRLRNASARLFDQAANRFRSLMQHGMVAAYPYYRDASRKLGKQTAVEDQLTNLVRSEPVVAASLAFECIEVFYDFGCGFTLSRARFQNSKSASTSDSLEVAEAAVLADHAEFTDPWFDKLRPESPCEKAVASFYDFWIAADHGQSERASVGFTRWTSAVTQSRAYSVTFDCWVFHGTRQRLQAPSPRHRAILLQMIDAMENANAPLPKWSDARA